MKKRIFFLFLLFVSLAGCSYEKKIFKNLERQGDILFSEGKKTEAIEKWQESLKLKKSANIYEKIVIAFIIEGENKKAKMWVEEGLIYFPNCVNLIYNLSYLNFLEKKYDECLHNINKLLAINQYYPEAHFLKGMIFEQTGEIEKAKEEYIKEINVNPGCKKAWKRIKEIGNEG